MLLQTLESARYQLQRGKDHPLSYQIRGVAPPPVHAPTGIASFAVDLSAATQAPVVGVDDVVAKGAVLLWS